MLRAKKEVEEKFEGDKWRLIADAVESAGGKKYPVGALQKRFKEVCKRGGSGGGGGDGGEENGI